MMFDFYYTYMNKENDKPHTKIHMDCKYGDILIDYDFEDESRRVNIAIVDDKTNEKVGCVSISGIELTPREIIGRLRRVAREYKVISMKEISEYLIMSNDEYNRLEGM